MWMMLKMWMPRVDKVLMSERLREATKLWDKLW
jgi:hypothetical protein